jgi:hypothetical protein
LDRRLYDGGGEADDAFERHRGTVSNTAAGATDAGRRCLGRRGQAVAKAVGLEAQRE